MRWKLWNPVAVIVAAGFSCPWSTTAAADTVVLKTGEVLSGQILRANKDEVSIQLESGGILSFRMNRVERIRQPDPVRGGSREYVLKDVENGKKGAPAAEAGAPGAAGDKVQPAQVAGPKEGGATANREGLSGFPLHALQAPSAAPPAVVTGWTSPKKLLDPRKGYSIVPPPGFENWPDPKMPPVMHGFIDPLTQANVTISVYDSDEPLDRVKEGVVALLGRECQSRVLQEKRREVTGPEGYKAWLLAMETPVNGTMVEQVQLIAKGARKVFIVTCSAAAESEVSFAQAFNECLESFRIQSPGKTQAEAEAPAEAEGPPSIEAAPSPPPPPPPAGPIGPGEIDEGRLKKSSDRIIERVDDRIRNSPYGK